MRINNLDHITSYNSISKENETKKTPVSGNCKYSTDRVEVSNKPSIDQIEIKLKDNILKTQNKKISEEKLNAIKEKISRNEYFVSTDDIIKSIL